MWPSASPDALREQENGVSPPIVHRLAALADRSTPPHAPRMVSISDAAASAIRAVFDQDGELSAAIGGA